MVLHGVGTAKFEKWLRSLSRSLYWESNGERRSRRGVEARGANQPLVQAAQSIRSCR